MAMDIEALPQPDQKEFSHAFDIVTSGVKEEINDCPVEQVRLTVPPTDNTQLASMTWRTWFLGLLSCCTLAFLNQFFAYRDNGLSVSPVAAQILTLPAGKFLAAVLPNKNVGVPLTNWKFSLNPGPFNVKEHVLITIFALTGANSVYAMEIINIVKAFYHRSLNPLAAYLLVITTMLLGYGWAGIYRKILVDSPYMWWPETMINISLFRALHEEEKRPKGGHTRLQFFLAAFLVSFVYFVFPGYFMPSLSYISIGCLIWKRSVLAQQISSGFYGLGIGSFTLDWNTVVAFTGNPISDPGFTVINIMIGFFVIIYIVLPACYWTNTYETKKFPFITTHTFDSDGNIYNVTRVLNDKDFTLNVEAYNGYSKLYMSVFFALMYGFNFATLTATISHVVLFYGKFIWEQWTKTTAAMKQSMWDVHTRLMKKNYETVPNWWFLSILISVFGLALLTCEGFGHEMQLPWWGLLLSCGIAFFFTLPVGIIQALTNSQVGLNVITEFVIGYLYPGRPLANVAFKTYGYISMVRALSFLSDFKLGHYMKIPPKNMFIVQLVGTMVSATIHFGTGWWLLMTVPNICRPHLLPVGSPWTCPGQDVFYNASIIWGVIGPKRMFTKLGIYPQLNWFFLIGLLAPVPVWLLSLKFPEKKWIKFINMPLILGATSNMPPARTLNYLAYGAFGILFNFYIFKKQKKWWAKHAYVLAAALNAGIAFMTILLYFALQGRGIAGPQWWGLHGQDHCTLASCPTAPGIHAEGCPAFYATKS